MPTVMAAHETQDGDFLQRVRRALLPDGFDNPAQDIRWAHAACDELARGYTAHEIAVLDARRHPDEGWSVAENEQWVRIAAAVYCPELL